MSLCSLALLCVAHSQPWHRYSILILHAKPSCLSSQALGAYCARAVSSITRGTSMQPSSLALPRISSRPYQSYTHPIHSPSSSRVDPLCVALGRIIHRRHNTTRVTEKEYRHRRTTSSRSTTGAVFPIPLSSLPHPTFHPPVFAPTWNILVGISRQTASSSSQRPTSSTQLVATHATRATASCPSFPAFEQNFDPFEL